MNSGQKFDLNWSKNCLVIINLKIKKIKKMCKIG